MYGVSNSLRALENEAESQRRAAAWYHSTELRLRLTFTNAYSGDLHIYAIDWDSQNRRERIVVNDGTTTTTVDLASSFVDGAWLHVPVNVPAGGVVTITATKTGGLTAVISGVFLGGAGAPPATPTPGPELQGDWVGRLGSRGYALAAWNNNSDRLNMPQVAVAITQGTRYRWDSSTNSLRALENEAESQRRAAAWYHSTELRLRLTFTNAYSGDLHIYAIDWDSQNRRERIVVNDGTTTTTVDLASSFVDGAWLHVPVNVPAGGVVTITATKTGGLTAVISGVFLGGAGAPP